MENEWEDYRFESEGFHLALDGDEILGFVHAGSLPANPEQESDARLGYIACLHVMPHRRRCGIGSQLLQRTSRYLDGCEGVFLDGQCLAPFYGNVQGPFTPFWGTTEGISIPHQDESTHKFLHRYGFSIRHEAVSLEWSGRLPAPSPGGEETLVVLEEAAPRLGETIAHHLPLRGTNGFFTVVALGDGCVDATAIVFPLTPLGEERWALYELQVAPSARGAGLGQRLVGRVIQEAGNRGATRIEVTTIPDLSPAAHHIYQSFGFREEARWNIY